MTCSLEYFAGGLVYSTGAFDVVDMFLVALSMHVAVDFSFCC